MAQVLAVHGGGQARHVGVPGHQVVGDFIFTQQPAFGLARPHQLTRVQELERPGHLFAGEEAFLRHHAFEHVDLGLVDEHAHLAGFGEVGLGGHQRQAGQRRDTGHAVAVRGRVRVAPTQRGGGHGSKGAPQAVARQVHRLPRGGVDVAQRVQHAGAHVGVHAHVGIARVGVFPGDDVHRVALRHQPAHHGVLRCQVQDVVLHDARRHDQHRLGVDLLGGGCVLDQLDQAVAQHHAARRDRDLLARHRVFLAAAARQFAALAAVAQAELVHGVVHALHEALAAGFPGGAHGFGVGQQPVAGRQHVQRLEAVEAHLLAAVVLHAVQAAGAAPPGFHGLGSGGTAAPRPLLPQRVGVARVGVDGLGQWLHRLGHRRRAGFGLAAPGVGQFLQRLGCGLGQRQHGVVLPVHTLLHGLAEQAPARTGRRGKVQRPIGVGQRQRDRGNARPRTGHFGAHAHVDGFRHIIDNIAGGRRGGGNGRGGGGRTHGRKLNRYLPAQPGAHTTAGNKRPFSCLQAI